MSNKVKQVLALLKELGFNPMDVRIVTEDRLLVRGDFYKTAIAGDTTACTGCDLYKYQFAACSRDFICHSFYRKDNRSIIWKKMRKCPYCGGKGERWVDAGCFPNRLVRCKYCKGTGVHKVKRSNKGRQE